MTIRLNGATSGYTEIDAPSAAGNNTLILPTGNGSASQYLQTNGTGTLSWNDPFRMVLETAKAYNWNGLTTNEVIDFENIPSWARRVTVMLQGISTNGTSLFIVQLGTSGGLQTTGYVSGTGDRAGETTSTAGFVLNRTGVAANTYSATVPICLYTTNSWITSGVINRVTDGFANQFAGAVTLSGTLDRIRITTILAGASNQFDAGNFNILY